MISSLQKPNRHYLGRFAPSPTGPLHFGSLVAALGSYLDARANQGEWRVRMEDLDQTREIKGAADAILKTLDSFGFEWDGEIIYQSRRTEAYREALNRLTTAGHAYPCGCSRKEINLSARRGVEGALYPGTCRNGLREGRRGRTMRLRVADELLQVTDLVQGQLEQNPQQAIGDFVIRRADGFHAYQLAVVVDDAWQGVTHIVRGADLLLSTPRQFLLQQLLELPTPRYAHLPLAVDATGRKLSKQYKDAPVEAQDPMPALLQALSHLGQPLPDEPFTNLDEFWSWAISHWRLERVPSSQLKPRNLT